jgi:hypothetical protein
MQLLHLSNCINASGWFLTPTSQTKPGCCFWWLLQAAPNPSAAAGDQLLLSSSRSEVLLWRADGFDAGALFTWPGITRGRFNSDGSQVCVCAGEGMQHSTLWCWSS